MTAADFLEEMNDMIGVKFRHQGRSLLGTDCIGLFVIALRAKGYLPTDFLDNPSYGRVPNSSDFIDTIEKFCTKLTAKENGCLIAFKWPQSKYPSHAAILDGQYMIHAYERNGKVVKHTYGQPWVRMTCGFYRLPGVEAPT